MFYLEVKEKKESRITMIKVSYEKNFRTRVNNVSAKLFDNEALLREKLAPQKLLIAKGN